MSFGIGDHRTETTAKVNEQIEAMRQQRSELREICYNAREAGLTEFDPGITFNADAGYWGEKCPGFAMRKELITPKQPGSPAFPAVCGNCRWYSIQA